MTEAPAHDELSATGLSRQPGNSMSRDKVKPGSNMGPWRVIAAALISPRTCPSSGSVAGLLQRNSVCASICRAKGQARGFSREEDGEQDDSDYRSWVEERLKSSSESGAQEAVDEPRVLAEESAAVGKPSSSDLQDHEPEVADELLEATAQAASEVSESSVPATDAIEAASADLEGPAEPTDLGAMPAQPQAAAPPEASSQSPEVASSSSPAPRRVTVREKAAALPDAVLGYRELGVSTGGDAAFLQDGQGRINRRRLFWPSQAYTVEDLVAKSQEGMGLAQRRSQVGLPIRKATDDEALRQADFRNPAFLHKFTSEAGQLPPRRVTRLQKKVHVHVMKQIKVNYVNVCSTKRAPSAAVSEKLRKSLIENLGIKLEKVTNPRSIARQMALLPPEGKLAELMPGASQQR